MTNPYDDVTLSAKHGESATLTSRNLFAVSLFPLFNLIPIVGMPIYLFISIHLASKEETCASIQSYVKVSLFLHLVLTIAAIVALLYFTKEVDVCSLISAINP